MRYLFYRRFFRKHPLQFVHIVYPKNIPSTRCIGYHIYVPRFPFLCLFCPSCCIFYFYRFQEPVYEQTMS